ncbi:MAG TPA: hypothetical protein VER11_30825 [Polyangiaceae bacterium]|nr:hypothetical protein [Polyangiaceae bacterium]
MMNPDAPLVPSADTSPEVVARSVLVRVGALCTAGVLSLWLTKLALFAAVGTLLGFVSLPAEPRRPVRWFKAALALAGVCATVGTFRFLVLEAVPGMVEGGTTATEQRAVSRLREILFAEDAWRKNAFYDPDGDRVGSAGLLGELTAEFGVRSGNRVEPPVLEGYPHLVDTRLGPAAEIGGYLVLVCLPKQGGGYTAKPADAIDDEAAERHFYAYAWPAERGQGLTNAYFLDEHERILRADSQELEPRRLIGVDAPPACDDISAPATAGDWRVWRHKKPRTSLPYDKP